MTASLSRLLQQANSSHRAGKISRATRLYQQALRIAPQENEALYGLGVLALQDGRDAEAGEKIQAAIALRGDIPIYHYALGNVWRQLKRPTDAVKEYMRAAELDRHYFDALFNLGAVLSDLLRPAEAAQALRLAISLRAEHPEAHLLLGLCLERLGQLDAAVEQYLVTLSLRRDDARAFLLLGGALFKAGHVAEADLAFARSAKIDPNQPYAQSRRVATLNYRGDLSARELYAAHTKWAARHADGLAERSFAAGRMETGRPLRIGYVSPNFYRHSVAHFLLPVLRAHDRAKVEIFCYSNSIIVDETTHALRAASDAWRVIVGKSDGDVAALIHAEGIDILVDLAGHTGDGRLLVFARRPAPVQVAWLGYPQTTGMKAMNYRLSDAIVEPAGEADALSAETIVRLPHGFHCFGQPGENGAGDGCEGEALDVAALPAWTNGFVTFGSFNVVQKMPPALVALWARVLKSVDGSRLLLKSLPDAVIADRYRAMFAEHGVDPARIEFLHWTSSRLEHLRLYDRMDIALDTFPYNGTTTTCEALWMGVPVLTLRGDRHVARVGASLLTRIGMEDWIAPDEDAYVEKAVARAGDLSALSGVRARLRSKMADSALCDARAFTRELETAYGAMWRAQSGPAAE